MKHLPALAIAVQGALLVGLTFLLIQPKGVPDPFGVGDALSWTLLCLIAGLPVFLSAARRQLPATRVDAFLWIYVACCLAVLPFSHDRMVSAVWTLSLAGNIAVFYGIVSVARASESIVAVVLVAVVLGVAVLQLIGLEYHLERGLIELTRAYDRPEGWNGYPELGLLACLQLAILIGMLQVTPQRLQKLILLAVIGVTVVELTFLYSRMAWAAAIVLFAVAPLTARLNRIRWHWAVAAAAVVVAIALAIGQTDTGRTLRERINEPSTVSGRLDIWRRTGQMIRDHPLSGVGIGNFQAVYEPIYNPNLNPDLRRGGHAHNLWLQVAAEQGIVTVIAYIGLWGAILVYGWQQRMGSWVQRAALLMVVVFAARSVGDYMFFWTGGAPARLHTLMWMAFGILGAAAPPTVRAR